MKYSKKFMWKFHETNLFTLHICVKCKKFWSKTFLGHLLCFQGFLMFRAFFNVFVESFLIYCHFSLISSDLTKKKCTQGWKINTNIFQQHQVIWFLLKKLNVQLTNLSKCGTCGSLNNTHSSLCFFIVREYCLGDKSGIPL